MKRSITAILAGGAVFGATVAFAATLTVDGNNLGAGADTDGISSCDTDGIFVDYAVAWDGTDKRYEVSSITAYGVAAACDGETLKVTLTGTGGASVTEVTTAVDNTAHSGTETMAAVDNVLPANVTGAAAVVYDSDHV